MSYVVGFVFVFLTTDGWSSGYRDVEGGGVGCFGVCMTGFDFGFV